MKRGMSFTEVLVSLVLIAILVVFAFEAIVNSLNLLNRYSLETKTVSFLSFVQTYLAEFRIGDELPSDLKQRLNNKFHGSNANSFPRVETLQATTTMLSTSNSQVKYRVVTVRVQKGPNEAKDFVFIFGL